MCASLRNTERGVNPPEPLREKNCLLWFLPEPLDTQEKLIKKIADDKYGTKSLVWSPTHIKTQWNKVHLPLLLSIQQARMKWLLIPIT